MPYARRIKNLVVRDETRVRRLSFGICKGCYFPINLRHQFRWLLGLYEFEIADFVRRWATPGSICYDIGAAQGYYTVLFGKLASPAVVYGVEADPKLFAVLQATINLNAHLQSQMLARRAFIGDVVDPSTSQTTLDALVIDEGWLRPTLMKIDVEGAETSVLRGAERLIEKASPRIILEVHSRSLEDECRRFLEQRGYRTTVVEQSTLLPDHRPLAHNRWLCAEPANSASPPPIRKP